MSAQLGESTLDNSIRFPILLMSSCTSSYTTLLTKICNRKQPLPWVLNFFCFHPSLPFHPTLNSSKPLSSLPFCFLKHPLCPALPFTYYSALNCCLLRHISLHVCWPMGVSHTDFFSTISRLANCFLIPATFDIISLS